MSLFRRMLVACHGVALIEFAFVLPIIMLMLFGGMEVSRAMLITQRAEKASYVIADITSQYPAATSDRASGEISETELKTNVFPQLGRIMGIYASDVKQAVILTSVRKESGINYVLWQAAGGGSMTQGVSSVVDGLTPGAIGSGVKHIKTSFPADIEGQLASMPDGENMIVAEIFYQYNPVWNQAFGAIPLGVRQGQATGLAPKLLVKRMFFRPRNGEDLVCLPDTFVYPECIADPTTPGGGGSTSCATGECTLSGYWARVPCSGCLANGSRGATVGIGCRSYECRNGVLVDVGTPRICVDAASCTGD